MTKKHFEAFAHEIRVHSGTVAERKAMAELVANVARAHNSRFNRDRFMAACGL